MEYCRTRRESEYDGQEVRIPFPINAEPKPGRRSYRSNSTIEHCEIPTV